MTNKSKTVVFFGTDDFSAPSLTMLIETGYDVRAVVTKPDSKSGRGQQVSAPLVKQIAEAHAIAVLQPGNLNDIVADLEKLGSAVGVLVSYGKIIPQNIIDLFTPGIINVHPSLLPKYRGSTPIESAIINGDPELGISIMQLSARMDAGPVYSQTTLALDGAETQPKLYASVAAQSAEELNKILPLILDGSCTPLPQDEDHATYTKMLQKTDAWFDPAAFTAAEVERKVRAHLEFPKTKINVAQRDVIITKSHAVELAENILDIACKDDTYLRIDELIAPSGKKVSGKDFLNGYAAA